MSVSFKVTGLEELRAALRALPAHLTGEAGKLIEGRANAAGVTLRSVYGQHRRSGNLQDHVVAEQKSHGPFGVAYRVASTAKHAWLFDNGSEARHYITQRGATHETGAMGSKSPPTHIFAATLARTRRKMHDDLLALLERNGLTVTGAP